MCAIQFRARRFVHVPDATEPPLYRDNPWVTGRLANVRFYASAPLIAPDGYALGTLYVFDGKVKELTDDQADRLIDLPDVLVALFERRRQARLTERLAVEAQHRQQFMTTILETINTGVVVADAEGHVTLLNRAVRDWHGLEADASLDAVELPGHYGLFDAEGRRLLEPAEVPLLRALKEGRGAKRRDGRTVPRPPDGAAGLHRRSHRRRRRPHAGRRDRHERRDRRPRVPRRRHDGLPDPAQVTAPRPETT
ncbi:PAS domain-containing protein, partial [Actinoplanes sp. URMC 104]|uniref:PAS domain-containing protein n=1 Tax=Actinoplanes sp. URMC 104 TaxID=3423409 RepID=UPI003F1A43F5